MSLLSCVSLFRPLTISGVASRTRLILLTSTLARLHHMAKWCGSLASGGDSVHYLLLSKACTTTQADYTEQRPLGRTRAPAKEGRREKGAPLQPRCLELQGEGSQIGRSRRLGFKSWPTNRCNPCLLRQRIPFTSLPLLWVQA